MANEKPNIDETIPTGDAGSPGEDQLSRRDFLRISAMLGGSAAFAAQAGIAWDLMSGRTAYAAQGGAYPLADAANVIYSACQQCNTNCGIKVKLVDGVVAKIDGSPYNPFTLNPHVAYKTSPVDAAAIDGAICPKGHAAIQTTYDPYRLVKVLKRAGQRGENKWRTIPFDEAVREISKGGKLFANVRGEEDRVVSGLEEIWALRDANVAKAMAEDVKKLVAEKEPEKKKALVAEFKTRFAADLDKLIDPDHPDLGPRNNQFVFSWGRMKGGRSDLVNRFVKSGFGSTNAHGHTTVCQGSLYFSGKAMSEQFQEGKFTGGDKFYWQADVENAEFVVFVGSSPFEANYGPSHRVPRITEGLESGRLKYAVIDPRLSSTAAKAWKWLPNKPGTEGAIALALIGWIVENRKYDEGYLRNANKAAAKVGGESTWSNASWLVKLDEKGAPGAFLRASEIGLTKKSKGKDEAGKEVDLFEAPGGKPLKFDLLVVLKDGKPVAFDPNGEEGAAVGDLVVDTALGEVRVKTGFRLLAESAAAQPFAKWAELAGVDARDLEAIARELTSHGKRAVADVHRGVSQHTNGFYNVIAWNSLNLLLGNYDWKGGAVKLSAYDASGVKAGGPFEIGKTPGAAHPFGLSIIRHDAKYEESTLFSGYPAKRNWYPLASDVYQEIIPSIGDAYPYPVKALLIYMGSPVYSLPAAQGIIDVLSDPAKLPLVIASDIVIGETSMYADYVFPDLTNLERWEFAGSHPSMTVKVQPIRQPTIAPLVETVRVFGQEMPVSLEALLLGIAEQLRLPGFGPDGFGKGQALARMDDLYVRMVANVAFGEKADGSGAVPDASDAEMKLFLDARKHLPKQVFDPEGWRATVGDALWRKVVYVLNRGGRFQDHGKNFDGEKVANKYAKLINLYQEKTAKTKSAMTGKALAGYPTYVPAPLDLLGRPLPDEEQGYDLNLITYKDITQTKSRTVSNYWLGALLPQNALVMNAQDAKRRGLANGDRVRVVSATNPGGEWDLRTGRKVPVAGVLKVVEGIRPGVVAFALGYGHFAYGGVDVLVDGQKIKGDARRIRGFHANVAMRVDPHLKNTTLIDPVGGSAVFYDSRVKIVKV
jgi:tetrathionate reductase subunit A